MSLPQGWLPEIMRMYRRLARDSEATRLCFNNGRRRPDDHTEIIKASALLRVVKRVDMIVMSDPECPKCGSQKVYANQIFRKRVTPDLKKGRISKESAGFVLMILDSRLGNGKCIESP